MISNYQKSSIMEVFFEATWDVMVKKTSGQLENYFIAYGFFRDRNYLSIGSFTTNLVKKFKEAGWKTELIPDSACSFFLKKNGTKILATVEIDDKGLKPDEISISFKEI